MSAFTMTRGPILAWIAAAMFVVPGLLSDAEPTTGQWMCALLVLIWGAIVRVRQAVQSLHGSNDKPEE